MKKLSMLQLGCVPRRRSQPNLLVKVQQSENPMKSYVKHILVRAVPVLLALAAITTVQAQSGAYYNAVTNLNPVVYLPLSETVQPLASTPAAINQGTLGTVDNGVYTHGAFPGVPGALTGDPDTGGLFTGGGGGNAHMSAAYDPAYASVTNFTVEVWLNSPTTDPGEDCIINCLDAGSPRAGWLIYTDANAVGTFNLRTYYQNGTSTAENYNIPVPR